MPEGQDLSNTPIQYHYHYYLAPPAPTTPRYQELLTLSRKSKIEIRKPEPFTGKDRWRWKVFITECLTMFNSKPVTYISEMAKVAFAASYLTETALSHYMTLLHYQPDHLALLNWHDFTSEFGRRFGLANPKVDAQQQIWNFMMGDWERFSNFITRFEQEAYETRWNDEALQSELYQALIPYMKDVMRLVPYPNTFQELKDLAMNINNHRWEADAEENRSNRPSGFPQHQENSSQHQENPPGRTTLTNVPQTWPETSMSMKPEPSKSKDSTLKPVPRPPFISNKEHDHWLKGNLCLNCRKTGHFAWECPDWKCFGRATFIVAKEESTTTIEELMKNLEATLEMMEDS
jgi:hypothetical protein